MSVIWLSVCRLFPSLLSLLLSRISQPVISLLFIDLNGIPETPAENCLIENLMGKTDKLIRMTDVKGFTLKNITIQSKDSTVLIDDGRNILFEQVHFQIPGGKVKIKTQGDLAKEPQFVRCLMKEY